MVVGVPGQADHTLNLAEVLARLRADHPSDARQPGMSFVTAWNQDVDRAYASPSEDLLDLLILNREVASVAGGVLGESFRRRAQENLARIYARLGLYWPGECNAGVHLDGEEKACLKWLAGWHSGLQGASSSFDFVPNSHTGRAVLDGFKLLSDPTDVNRMAEFAGVADNRRDHDKLLGFVKRLVRLKAAEGYLTLKQFKLAHGHAQGCGADGLTMAMRVDLATRSLDSPMLAQCLRTARFHAYKCRRLASRCTALGLPQTRDLYQAAERNWKELTDLLQGETHQ